MGFEICFFIFQLHFTGLQLGKQESNEFCGDLWSYGEFIRFPFSDVLKLW